MAYMAIVYFVGALGKKLLHIRPHVTQALAEALDTELFLNEVMSQKALWIMRQFWLYLTLGYNKVVKKSLPTSLQFR